MTKTSMQLRQQIQKLEQQADALARKEAEAVLARVREAITYYGFKPKDLFPADRALSHTKAVGSSNKRKVSSAAKGATVVKGPAARRKIAVKYRDRDGNTWTGRGSRPRWLVAAISEGRSIEDFAV